MSAKLHERRGWLQLLVLLLVAAAACAPWSWHLAGGGESEMDETRRWVERLVSSIDDASQAPKDEYAEGPASARGSGGSSCARPPSAHAPRRLLRAGAAVRMPPLAERGTEPQILLFELDVLASRYPESLWESSVRTSARPGLIEGGRRLHERFPIADFNSARAELDPASIMTHRQLDELLSPP